MLAPGGEPEADVPGHDHRRCGDDCDQAHEQDQGSEQHDTACPPNRRGDATGRLAGKD